MYRLALGGTAVGTGINAPVGFAESAAAEIAKLTGVPFITAPNEFAVQGAHDALVQFSGALRTVAVSLDKIANDIGCCPRPARRVRGIAHSRERAGIVHHAGQSQSDKVEALTMIAVQVMANDVAYGFGGAGGHLEINVYKPLMTTTSCSR